MRKVIDPKPEPAANEEMVFVMKNGHTITLEDGWQWVEAKRSDGSVDTTACGRGRVKGARSQQYFELPDRSIAYRWSQ